MGRVRVAAMLALALMATEPCRAAQEGGAPADAPRILFFSTLTSDYTRLFAAPEQWPRSLAAIKVLQLSVFFVHLADDALLRRIITFLHDHDVDLALEGQMLTPGPDGCGAGVEGYAEPGAMQAVAARLKALGGEVRFVGMDEPLWFGHVATRFWRPSAPLCRAPVEEVAATVARTVAAVRSVFPDVAIGDTEVMDGPAAAPPDYPAMLGRWATAFAEATGRPLAFMHFDIPWTWEDAGGTGRPPWAAPLRETATQLAAMGRRRHGPRPHGRGRTRPRAGRGRPRELDAPSRPCASRRGAGNTDQPRPPLPRLAGGAAALTAGLALRGLGGLDGLGSGNE